MDSGCVAMNMALDNGHDVIYLLGFDFGSTNEFVNNVYGEGIHLMKEDKPNQLSSSECFLKGRSDIDKFIRVINEHSVLSLSCHNIKEINVEQFLKCVINDVY